MIHCESFRTRFGVNADDPAVLEHLRACDRCLDFAAQQDPDVMFRALGGAEMMPPGGVDAFVDDVMTQVRVRSAEDTVHARPEQHWARRLAIAATIAAGVTGAAFFYSSDSTIMPAVSRPVAAVATKTFATKPVVESYESQNATIVEVPGEEAGNDDVKIVMIFDENLPADL